MGQEIEALMEMGSGSLGASGCSGSGNNDPRHGLKFGEKIYFGDLGGGNAAGGSSSVIPASPPASAFAPQVARPPPAAAAPKRGKGVVPGGQQQPPRCQVEGCRADLTGTKAYYCRHKVCGMHSKSPKVVVAGLEQRFCQQCSRFHQLHEFDQGKRSCRRRLAGHNERRRKPTAATLKTRYGLLSSPFPDGGRFGSVLMNFSYPRLPATPGEDLGSSSQWHAAIDSGGGGGGGGMMPDTTHAFVQSSAGASLFTGQEMQPSEGLGVTDSGCALSLLSTRPWGAAAAAAAATARVRAPTNSGNHYGGTPMAQPAGAAGGFMSNSWGFPGHGCNGAREIPRESGFGLVGRSGGGHSSGELELALQGDKQGTDNAHGGRAYCAPGNLAHWSL